MPGIPQDTRSPFQQLRLIEIKNVGATDIPAYGAVEITGVTIKADNGVVMEVRRPTCDSSPRIMFNLFNALPSGKYGVGTNEFPCWALSDTTSNGDRVGSQEDSYILAKGQSGFIVAGGSREGATRVQKPTSEVALYDAVLEANMCSGSANITNITRVGACCDEESITGTHSAENKYNLQGCAGDSVLVLRACVGDAETWRIIQITHHLKEVLLETPYFSNCQLKFPKLEIPVMHCCPADSEVFIQMFEHAYVADAKLAQSGGTTGTASGGQVCELQLQSSLGWFCAFEAFSPGPLTNIYTPITFGSVHVQVNTVDDGTCIQKVRQWVYVLCWDDPETPEDVLCLEECEEGTV